MNALLRQLRPALLSLVVLTVLLGLAYPFAVLGVDQVAFNDKANGSLIKVDGTVVGSRLIGQGFAAPEYFHPRPSAAGAGYDGESSSGSNLGPTNPDYLKTVGDRVKALRDTGVTGKVPADLVQASASGLDPHITPESALLQVPRVAKARGVSEDMLVKAVAQATEGRQLGFLGELRVNVLELNVKLDGLK
jgi:potassium-transporting ATPase KdpC subunit